MPMIKVAVIQMNAQADKAANVRRAFALMARAVAEGAPDLIVLPENFTCYSTDATLMAKNAEDMPGGRVYTALAEFARRHGVVVHAGSMSEKGADKPYNTSVVFDGKGREIARYRKIHRFDIVAPDGASYLESAVVERGNSIVTYAIGDLTVGCAICFDLRFGELFRALLDKGADVIVIPSAFTHATGKAHWKTLIQSRAIEFQAYVVASDQTGTFDEGAKRNWGHSLIVDPWGEVLAEAGEEEAILYATLDKAKVEAVRGRIPVQKLRVL